MWIDTKCPECGGTGDKPGLTGFDDKGVFCDGSLPCARCNGEGQEASWMQECRRCDQTGTEPGSYGALPCHKCLGRGYYPPEPESRFSRYELIDDGWKEL